MKKLLALCIVLLSSVSILHAQDYQLTSPDGHIQLMINTKPALHFKVVKKGEVLIPETKASMALKNGKVLTKGDKVKRKKETSVNTTIHRQIPTKSKNIPNHYNQLVLQYKGQYHVVFRAYDDAIAYRFVTDFKAPITVKDEKYDVSLPKDASAWFSLLTGKDNVSDRWMNEYQHVYTKEAVGKFNYSSKRTELPLLVDLHKKGKVLITESDLYDYPSLYFKAGSGSTLQSIFPPRVKTERKNKKGENGWDRTIHPATVYDYIAKTSGKRTFPWRIMAFADHDTQLLNNEIVYKLAKPNQLKETKWIKPGQVAWDWWNHWNITGVDFKAGINNKTYEYYIDFAARHDIPYIIMDDGWYVLGDLTKESPNIDVAHLCQYGKKKGVGVILWCSWHTLNKQMKEAMDQFQRWGVKGIKVDFMRRDDQDVVDFYWRTAKEAAQRHLLVDFHGSYNPVGLERTYPNIVNYESVAGMENSKWTDKKGTPGMAVALPFIRMFTGPMDYTPGAMRNAQKKDFRAIYDHPMSQGTRCQQLAMYVLYDAPLQMLSDSPTLYEKNKESLDFITSVPTTWDKTIPLAGKVGQYVAMARKKGNEYFAAAMTNWDARDLTLDLSFLPKGTWHIEIFKDGVNADRNGVDYKKIEKTINNTDQLKIHMAPGGGWAARIYK
jgi:alpha-glucosidase